MGRVRPSGAVACAVAPSANARPLPPRAPTIVAASPPERHVALRRATTHGRARHQHAISASAAASPKRPPLRGVWYTRESPCSIVVVPAGAVHRMYHSGPAHSTRPGIVQRPGASCRAAGARVVAGIFAGIQRPSTSTYRPASWYSMMRPAVSRPMPLRRTRTRGDLACLACGCGAGRPGVFPKLRAERSLKPARRWIASQGESLGDPFVVYGAPPRSSMAIAAELRRRTRFSSGPSLRIKPTKLNCCCFARSTVSAG